MHHRLLTLHCLSPLHCGTGQGIAGIDLPVQRERHTGWPLIPGSSIKGVLRDAYRAGLDDTALPAPSENRKSRAHRADVAQKTIALFGSEPRGDVNDLGLGALALGDAILLAFPVRSLVGVFAWCTCPLALGRVARLNGGEALADGARLKVGENAILCADSLVADDKQVVLEDHALTREPLPPGLVEVLSGYWHPDATDMLANHLAVLSDTLFTWFARHATQVEARIALDPATKTVSNGQLFYEETVPPESVFVAPVSAEDARHPAVVDQEIKKATYALSELERLVQGKTLQFGGKATIGRGQCALRLTEG